MIPDLSLVFRQLARIAAEADGHKPGCAFIFRDGGVLACSCGEFTYEAIRPVTLVPSPAAGTGGAA